MTAIRPEGFNYLPEAWRAYIAGMESQESVRSEARNVVLEEAAKVCERRADYLDSDKCVSENGSAISARNCADNIRACKATRSPYDANGLKEYLGD